LDIRALRRDDDAANYHGTAIGHGHLGFRRLGIQSRNSLNAWDTVVDLRILHEHVHEHCAFGGDLRGDFQFQYGVNELHRDRVIDRRLNRDLSTLLDRCLLVVLRDDLRLRKKLADALSFRCGDKKVDSKVR